MQETTALSKVILGMKNKRIKWTDLRVDKGIDGQLNMIGCPVLSNLFIY